MAAVKIPATLTLLRKVAPYEVIILSVDATPVNPDPSPENSPPVTTPATFIPPTI